jgi:ankyrin repeat protein
MTKKWPKKKDRPDVDQYGRTDVHNSVIEKDITTLMKLLSAGKNIDSQDDNGWTALHFAAQSSNIEIINLLLKNNANPNLIDIHGNSPLWTATMNARGNFDCVEALLKYNARPDEKNNAGRSPLDMANTIKNGLDKIFLKHAKYNAEQGAPGYAEKPRA